MNDTDWPTYLAALSTNQSEIARAAGVATATVSRWTSRSTQPLAPQVIAVARAYNQSPVVALVAAGYLTREEVEREVTLTPGMSLAEFSELEIAQELVRRIEAGETTQISDQPINVSTGPWEYHDTDVSGQPEHEREVNFTLEVVLNSREVELRDREGSHVFNDVDDAFKAIRNRMMHNVSDIEALPHAALTTAREVEEDQHTP